MPSADTLLNDIDMEANAHLSCPDLPANVVEAWNLLKAAVQQCRAHGSSCTSYTCQELWQQVSNCREAVVALHGDCGALPPPICFELNHADPTPYMTRVPSRPLR
jgi:hypothetical protein